VGSNIERVLAALTDAGVRYLIVGGVAVVLHGHLRTTADLDLFVDLESDNARRAIAALGALGFKPRAPVAIETFADAGERQRFVAEKGMVVFSLWNRTMPAFEVDLFVAEPLPFVEAYARAVTVELSTTKATVIALDDLVALKKAAGRPRDVEDIRALLALRDDDVDG
jgi:hypothetical protein